jgi:hypothetical protein
MVQRADERSGDSLAQVDDLPSRRSDQHESLGVTSQT